MFHRQKRKAGKECTQNTHTKCTHTPLHPEGKIWLSYWISLIRRDTPTQGTPASLAVQRWCTALSLDRPEKLNSYCTTVLLDLGLILLLLKTHNLHLFKTIFKHTHQAHQVLKANSALGRPYPHHPGHTESTSLRRIYLCSSFSVTRMHISTPFWLWKYRNLNNTESLILYLSSQTRNVQNGFHKFYT